MRHVYARSPFKNILGLKPRRASEGNRAAVVADDASIKSTVGESVAIQIDDIIDECPTREFQWISPSAEARPITTIDVGNLIVGAE
ncbi:hypothetical protein [Sphingomonas crocodyli]|uniref:Uncharacterized protein n=1 Tax=Sphingomonas crocodyli TaxID=1979270 RepID=A0A437LY92_9SPHN|nr:hypothetical protein [Sphingomonas crocodyli]RVT90409.1 hypothetical protein EOD43_19295 [Sphingomonas crocodyli]